MEHELSEKQQQHLAGVSVKQNPDDSTRDEPYDGYLDIRKWNEPFIRRNQYYYDKRNPKQVIIPGEYRTVKTMPPTFADGYKVLLKHSYKNQMLASVIMAMGISRKAIKYWEKHGLIKTRLLKDDTVISIIRNEKRKELQINGKILIVLPFRRPQNG